MTWNHPVTVRCRILIWGAFALSFKQKDEAISEEYSLVFCISFLKENKAYYGQCGFPLKLFVETIRFLHNYLVTKKEQMLPSFYHQNGANFSSSNLKCKNRVSTIYRFGCRFSTYDMKTSKRIFNTLCPSFASLWWW